MAKGHRLLKKKKAEKSKVKLKGSKHLPKGTNVTDTSFKVKQIVIPQQLKVADDSELLSKRKLNVKELLSRMQHYNTTVRTDAVSGLKELVTLHAEQVIFENLSQLLQGVSPLVLDKEKSVRRDSIKLLALILSPVSVEKLTPFFDILCSYLRCAMTHIDPNIQEDSLLLLDDLLGSVPSLIADNSHKILPNFFDLISKLRSDSKPGRTLTVSLGNKITGIKWRVKVLSRLYGILDAVITNKMQERMDKSDGFVADIIQFDKEKLGYLPIYNTDNIQYAIFSLQDTSSNISLKNMDNYADIVDYIDILVPLLLDTWLEVGPGMKSGENNLDSTLSEEAVTVLNCSLNILQLLWKFIKIYEKEYSNSELGNSFISKYRKDFSNYIVKTFPYTQSVIRKRKRNETEIHDSGCTNENLMICYLFCVFNKKIIQEKQIAQAKLIVKYIHDCLNHEYYISSKKQLFFLLKYLLVDVSKSWLYANVDLSKILESTISYYNNTKLSENFRFELFNILCEVVHLDHLNKTISFQIWLSQLPNLLLQTDIFEKTVDVICLLAKQKNALFVNSLVENYSKILNNIPKLIITNRENKYPVIFKIIGLLIWIPIFDKSNLEILKTFLVTLEDEIIKKYFVNLLELRYDMKNEAVVLEYLNMLK